MINEWVSKAYLGDISSLQKKFQGNNPFQHIVLENFFNEDRLKEVLIALQKQLFIEKNTDLFQFKQTSVDFKSIENKALHDFYSFFSSKEFIELIAKITGTNLNSIDMSGFIYSKTDYLLPHDDQLEDRKIAYVVNLSDFTEKDGGKLELFDSKDHSPTRIIQSHSPKFNSLVLFLVHQDSWHQVEEVFTDNKRISIAGWFHGN